MRLFCEVMIIRILNFIAPLYFCLTKGKKEYRIAPCEKKGNRIIVTFTSYPGRIGRIWLVIETILRQKTKPDRIILWLSKMQFSSLTALPKRLLAQRERGLEIRLVEEDFKSHKKYFYALQEFPNDFLVTIDDDIFYESSMIKRLVNCSLANPNIIISRYCKKIIWNESDLCPYSRWQRIDIQDKPNCYSFFGTGGGTLMPPGIFHQDVLKKELFMKLTPTADDIWLNAMCRMRGTKICCLGNITNYLPVKRKDKSTLDFVNNVLNQNDQQIKDLIDYYLKNTGKHPFKTL